MILKFYNFILETLESPAQINWKNSTNSLKGTFEVQRLIQGAKINYKFVILSKLLKNCEGLNAWDFKFYWNDGGDIIYSLTGFDENKFKILSTVIKGFIDLMETKNPNSIVFRADLSEDSRVKFYNRLTEKAITKYGFKLHKFPFSTGNKSYLIYILYKNKDHLPQIINATKQHKK
jgi:hypothetical protein